MYIRRGDSNDICLVGKGGGGGGKGVRTREEKEGEEKKAKVCGGKKIAKVLCAWCGWVVLREVGKTRARIDWQPWLVAFWFLSSASHPLPCSLAVLSVDHTRRRAWSYLSRSVHLHGDSSIEIDRQIDRAREIERSASGCVERWHRGAGRRRVIGLFHASFL